MLSSVHRCGSLRDGRASAGPDGVSGSHDGPKYHDAGIVAMEHLIGPNFLIEKNDIKCKEDIRTIVLDVMSKPV